MDELFKKCKVVILSSKKKHIGRDEFQLCEDKNGLYLPISDSSKREALENNNVIYKHLYILSNDEIKEEDIVLETERNRIGKVVKSEIDENGIWECKIKTEDLEYYPVNLPRKIIASTDNSLGILSLSNDFINEYIKVNGFDEVLVKYVTYNSKEYVIKGVNNCVITKSMSTFNKEELPIQAIKDCLKYCENQQIYDKLSKYGDFYYKLNQFIKQNNF